MKTSGISQAVILAGGLGTRLRPLTYTTPKPMIFFHGKPFLEYIVKLLKKNDIHEIVILTGYLEEKIRDYFKDGKKFGISIKYSHSDISADTGLRLKKASPLLSNEFLLLYCDNIWPLNLPKLITFYRKHKVNALVTVYSNRDHYTTNNIFVDDSGYVRRYDRKRNISKPLNGVDIGFFILKKKIIDLLPSTNSSFEDTVIPKLIHNNQLAGYVSEHKYYGLSNLERIAGITEYLKIKKIIFLDRDGVINSKPQVSHYVTNFNEFNFLPKAKEAIALLTKHNYKIFIITNQAGVARGLMTIDNLNKIHKKMKTEIIKSGGKIEDIFVCIHGWNDKCFCRKPNPGLFFEAASKYHINLYNSYYVGDEERDMLAGSQAGCKTYLVNSKNNLYDIVSQQII